MLAYYFNTGVVFSGCSAHLIFLGFCGCADPLYLKYCDGLPAGDVDSIFASILSGSHCDSGGGQGQSLQPGHVVGGATHGAEVQGMILSPALQPIPGCLVCRILSGEFIEMRDFLTDNITLHDQAVQGPLNLTPIPGALQPRL